jgi:hypothetical protein
LWRKQTQNLLSSGNTSIDNAVSNLQSNKDKRQTRLCVFARRGLPKLKNDLNAINLLTKDANPAQLKR